MLRAAGDNDLGVSSGEQAALELSQAPAPMEPSVEGAVVPSVLLPAWWGKYKEEVGGPDVCWDALYGFGRVTLHKRVVVDASDAGGDLGDGKPIEKDEASCDGPALALSQASFAPMEHHRHVGSHDDVAIDDAPEHRLEHPELLLIGVRMLRPKPLV